MQQPSIILVDDDPAVLDALGLYLESKGFGVVRLDDAKAALARVTSAPADACIVCDVRMPGMTGLELQDRLRAMGSPVPLILITGHGDIDMAVRAIKAGAHDFLEKPFQEHRLVASIQAALAAARARQSEVDEVGALRGLRSSLTERERHVMDLAVEGLTNRDIGAKLGISFRTVEIHRANAMEKMGAASLADLVRMSIKLREA
ncbi:MAG: response regulator transcription factor [Hyphomicrobiales bacterium]|nr:MAG: response regulator transcription factor [Hyphomicrobiales bacterium]